MTETQVIPCFMRFHAYNEQTALKEADKLLDKLNAFDGMYTYDERISAKDIK